MRVACEPQPPHYQPFSPSNVPNMLAPQQFVPPSFRPTGVNAVRQDHSHSQNAGSTFQQSSQQCCPPLTPIEIDLLDKHKGCRKCHCFYVGHQVPTCPHSFPDGATYCMLTKEMAFEAMRKIVMASTYSDPTFTNSSSTASSSFPTSEFMYNAP